MNKKIWAALICMLIIISLIPSAFAAEPTLTVSDAGEVRPGDEFTVTVTMADNPGIAVAQIFFHYDESCLERVSILGDGFKGWTIGDSAVWVCSEIRNYDYNGVIFTIKFRVKDSAPNGRLDISVSADIANVDEQSIDFKCVSGGATVAGSSDAKQTPAPTGAPQQTAAPTLPPQSPAEPAARPQVTDPAIPTAQKDDTELIEPDPPITSESTAEEGGSPADAEQTQGRGFFAAIAEFFAKIWHWIVGIFA